MEGRNNTNKKIKNNSLQRVKGALSRKKERKISGILRIASMSLVHEVL